MDARPWCSRVARAIGPAVVLLAVVAPAAAAATAAVENGEVVYRSAPGEHGVLVAHLAPSLVTFSGAPVTPGAGCRSEGDGATCEGPTGAIRVELGDGDDTLSIPVDDEPAGRPVIASGGGGDDDMWGAGAADVLEGGGGNDRLYPGEGDDALRGGDGDDELVGWDGVDALFGGAGQDRLEGGYGDDTLYGEDGHDSLDAGPGRDRLVGGRGGDANYGWEGDDVIDARDSNAEGADVGECGAGRDELYADHEDYDWSCELIHWPHGDHQTPAPPTTGGFWAPFVPLDGGFPSDVAVTASGTAVVSGSSESEVWARAALRGGPLGGAQVLDREPADTELVPVRDGVVAGWSPYGGAPVKVAEASMAGEFGPAVSVGGLDIFEGLVASASGDAAVLGRLGGSEGTLAVSYRLAPGAWSDPEPIASLHDRVGRIEAVMTDDGEVLAAWAERAPQTDLPAWLRLVAHRRGAGDATRLTVTDRWFSTLELATDRRGRATLVFDERVGMQDTAMKLAYRNGAGEWGSPQPFPDVRFGLPSTLTMTPDGEVLFVGQETWPGQLKLLSGPVGGPLRASALPANDGLGEPMIAASPGGRLIIGGLAGPEQGVTMLRTDHGWGPWEDIRGDCTRLLWYDALELAVNDSGVAAALTRPERGTGRALSVSALDAGPPARGCSQLPSADWVNDQYHERHPAIMTPAGPAVGPFQPPATDASPVPRPQIRRVRLVRGRTARVDMSCPATCRVQARADLRAVKRSRRRMIGARSVRLREGTHRFSIALKGRRPKGRRLRLGVRFAATGSPGRRWSGQVVQPVRVPRPRITAAR